MGPTVLGDGSVLHVPSDDEMIPAERSVTPALSPPSVVVDSELEPQRPNVQTPKRSGVGSDSPSPQRFCTTSQGAQEFGALGDKKLGGNEFRAQDGFLGRNRPGAMEVTTDDPNNAMNFPVLGRPAYSVLLGFDGP